MIIQFSTNIATCVDLSAGTRGRVYQRKGPVKYVLLVSTMRDESTVGALIVENTDNSTCLLKSNPGFAPKSMFNATKEEE